MEKSISIFKRRIGTSIYNTGVVSRALSSQSFSEKGFEITPEQFLILDILVECGELHQRRLCEITLKDRANIARIVNILKEKGFLKKIEAVNGRKIFKLIVTPEGKKIRDEILPTVLELRSILSTGVSQKEMEITLNTLKKIYENARSRVKLQI